MPEKIRSVSNLSQNTQKVVISTYICFYLIIQITSRLIIVRTNALWPLNQNFGWAMAHPSHLAPCSVCLNYWPPDLSDRYPSKICYYVLMHILFIVHRPMLLIIC